MRVLVAPNSMKRSLDAFEFADAVAAGLKEAGINDVIKLPVADGGDGTAKVLSAYYNSHFVPVRVSDPLGRDIESGFYFDNSGTAIIEMADASGLKLLSPSEYSALNTTSYGVGQIIESAIKSGAKNIIIGLGGSATVDGGMGALMALGVKFYNSAGEIEKGDGLSMGDVIFIDRSHAARLLFGVRLLLLTDVKNPLLGGNGAASIYGPQKGASPYDVKVLEKNLSLFAGALFQTTGNDISKMPSGGAAGGIAAAFHSLFDAEIVDGASYIIEKSKFEEIANNVDVIITGEGKIDETTFRGKAPGEVLKIGMKIDKPVYAICGSYQLRSNGGFKEIFSITSMVSEDADSVANAAKLVKAISVKLGVKLKEIYGRES